MIPLFNGTCQNLQKISIHFLRRLLPFQRCQFLIFFILKKFFKATCYNFRNVTIRWHLPKSTNVCHTFFLLALAVSDIYIFNLFTFKKYVKVTLQFSQFCHSIANIKIYERLPHIFYVSSNCFEDKKKFTFIKGGQCHGVQFCTPFDGKCKKLQMSPKHFPIALPVSAITKHF